MTEAQFRKRLEEIAVEVRKWPLWKQNILQDSLSPTVPVPRTPLDNSGVHRVQELRDQATVLQETLETILGWAESPCRDDFQFRIKTREFVRAALAASETKGTG